MTKKSSVSSQPGKLLRVKAEDILGKALTREQCSELARLKNRPDNESDYSDIPPLTEEQLARAFQPNRQLIAVRLDRDVMAWLRSFGHGYTARVNTILRRAMDEQQAKK